MIYIFAYHDNHEILYHNISYITIIVASLEIIVAALVLRFSCMNAIERCICSCLYKSGYDKVAVIMCFKYMI